MQISATNLETGKICTTQLRNRKNLPRRVASALDPTLGPRQGAEGEAGRASPLARAQSGRAIALAASALSMQRIYYSSADNTRGLGSHICERGGRDIPHSILLCGKTRTACTEMPIEIGAARSTRFYRFVESEAISSSNSASDNSAPRFPAPCACS